MSKHTVALKRYEKPGESVRGVVEACGGLEAIKPGIKAFIKPNIVFWTKSVPFPKWGVITTSRVVTDMVELLKDHGVDDITIGEGTVVGDPKDTETMAHAFEYMGYNELAKRYGVKVMNVFEHPFRKVDLGGGVELSMCAEALDSDLVVDLPVMKTHAQTVVTLGTKNLKGLIDVNSRKKCHNADPEHGLNYMIARLAQPFKQVLTVIDGIYTTERGPSFDGKVHRSNLLAAGLDVLSTDMVGARCLGWDPAKVPHLVNAANNAGRPIDMSDVEVVGLAIDEVAKYHEYTFPYTEDGALPVPMKKMGISGLVFNKYDDTLCTYCSGLNGVILTAIAYAWQGKPWNEIEVLTGKRMDPTPGMNKTILVGKCMYAKHKNNPEIKEMLAIKGCPPKPDQVAEALHAAGIEVNPEIFANMDKAPGFFLSRYEGKPEFEEGFFQVS